MNVSFKKVPKEWISAGGPNYVARAVDVTGKWEFTYMVQSSQNLPKFIKLAEQALKETCSEVVFMMVYGQRQEMKFLIKKR